MNLISNEYKNTASLNKQRGVVLVVSLIMLILVSMMGIHSMRTSIIQEKMASNWFDRLKALQAAEAGVRFGVSQINTTAFSMDDFVNNVNKKSFYDMRQQGAINQGDSNKTANAWLANRSPSSWPWTDADKRGEIAHHIDSANSMGLIRKPQFAIGMQEAILRAGSEGFICLPYTVIGAGKGATASTNVLIEVKVIPKSGCKRKSIVN